MQINIYNFCIHCLDVSQDCKIGLWMARLQDWVINDSPMPKLCGYWVGCFNVGICLWGVYEPGNLQEDAYY